MVDQPHILIYRFHEAPAGLRALSTAGGDEDWIILIPHFFDTPDWLDRAFGMYQVDEHDWGDYRACIVSH